MDFVRSLHLLRSRGRVSDGGVLEDRDCGLSRLVAIVCLLGHGGCLCSKELLRGLVLLTEFLDVFNECADLEVDDFGVFLNGNLFLDLLDLVADQSH